MTRKAAARLAEADLVLYDALVSPEVLELARSAHRFFVGKRAGRPAISQGAINRLMVRAALRGKRVVRLKCGDPFVFGRGGEEAVALHAASVPFEVVPGISTAIAAPALAGIPVTHRGLASGFAVVTGHSASAYRPMLESIAPNTLTLVVLMGLGSRGAIAQLLLDRGWTRSTPAAVLMSASTERAAAWIGTLADLGSDASEVGDGDGPGTIVIGEVVTLSSVIAAPAAVSISTSSEAVAAGRGR